MERLILIVSLLLAAIGCDSATNLPVQADGGVYVGADASTGNVADADVAAGECEALAREYCEFFEGCDAELFLGAYESSGLCRNAIAEACENSQAPTLQEPTECLRWQMTSCDSLFALGSGLPGGVPDACKLPVGEGGFNDLCSSDLDCGYGLRTVDGRNVRFICKGSPQELACFEGRCAPPQEPMGGNLCTRGLRCDEYGGEFCVQGYDADAAARVDGRTTCQPVQFGENGDACAPGSSRQCGVGLVCDELVGRCMAALQRGQRCDPQVDLCDTSRGLSCTYQDSTGSHTCEGVDYAQVGAQCGTFTERGEMRTRVCSAYAICSDRGDGVSTCELRVREGESCTNEPDNCLVGLRCEDGVCSRPSPAAC